MAFLLDMGILLRLANRDDLLHEQIRHSVRLLKQGRELVVATLQNAAEFWNVCTRPQSARGGLGLNVEQTNQRLRLLERVLNIFPEPNGLYVRWRELVVAHQVLGVQVHDAKLVAAMSLHGITNILTLNDRDFARYPQVTAFTPQRLINSYRA